MAIPAILAALLPLLGDAIKRVIPDPEAQSRVQAEITQSILANTAQLEQAAAEVVKAEAQGESWLQRSWRPIVMLTFCGLIVARWLGYAAPGMSEQEIQAAWSVMELGLGGYVIGRSVEKVAPSIAEAIKRK